MAAALIDHLVCSSDEWLPEVAAPLPFAIEMRQMIEVSSLSCLLFNYIRIFENKYRGVGVEAGNRDQGTGNREQGRAKTRA
jgi:hypothetical protein